MKKFLFGTGKARAFINGQLYFYGTTLIDTSMGIEVSSTDVRAGYGNNLITRYFHDSSLTMTITDAQFNIKTIALNVGSPESSVGGNIFGTEPVTLSGRVGTLTQVTAANIVAVSGDTKNVYFEYDGINYSVALDSGALTFTVPESIPQNSKLCVSYLKSDSANSETFVIPANYIPSIVDLYVDVQLFGDKEGQGSIGKVTIHIPKFQLDGSQTISMTADGTSNTSFTGVALSSEEEGECEVGGIYAELVETLNNQSVLSGVTALAIQGGDFDMSSTSGPVTLRVYGVKGATSFLIPNSQLTFENVDSEGHEGSADEVISVSAAGVVTRKAAGSSLITAIIPGTEIEASCTVTVS